jgi:hypothetical protein
LRAPVQLTLEMFCSFHVFLRAEVLNKSSYCFP